MAKVSIELSDLECFNLFNDLLIVIEESKGQSDSELATSILQTVQVHLEDLVVND